MAKPKNVKQADDPLWLSGIQSGYDTVAGKWRSAGGKFTTRAQALANLTDDLSAFGAVLRQGVDVKSSAAERLENFIAGEFSPFTPQEAGPATKPFPIPGNILSGYRLARFYYRSEGDVASAFETPIQVSMRDLEIRGPSLEVKQELEMLYDVDGLDLQSMLASMWLSVAVFGVAHPLTVYENGKLRGILLLPPPYVSVGSHLSHISFVNPASGEWTETALKTLLPVDYYQAFFQIGEIAPTGEFLIKDGMVDSVRGLDQRWEAYPKPHMQGAFRALSTRIIYEEMRRAIFEGYRHILWLFLLGDMEHKPSPEMMKKLRDDVDGLSGERTGKMAWWGGLDVKVITPGVTGEIIASETWWTLSLDIFRRLGISMRGSTGNTLPTERGADFEVDADLMIEKFEYMRRQLLWWERRFRLNYGKTSKKGEAWLRAARETEVVFSSNALELRTSIRDRLLPLFQAGLLSPQTTLAQSGQNYEAERQAKEGIRKANEAELWFAPPTYSQTTVGPNGATQNAASAPQGKPIQVNAARNDEVERKRRAYLALLLAAYHEFLPENPAAFIAELKRVNVAQLDDFGLMGYRDAGGMLPQVPEPWRGFAAPFINKFADHFLGDLENNTTQMDVQRRTLMYGEEGHRMAYLQGVQAAMEERGATHWRRALHPELSRSGPCPLCLADAQILHSIDEPFLSLHPNEMCSMAPIRLRFSGAGNDLDFGIRGVTENEMSEILRQAGIEAETNVRRTRR